MPSFLIIRGPLGSGKSTVSRELAKRLNAKHFHMDEILEKNGLDTIPPGAPCIPAENFIQANEIVLPEAKELLAAGKPVIFDACFYHQNVIEHLIQNLPFPHKVFTLKLPVELCIERDSKRPKPYGEGAAYAVHSLVPRFDYGTIVDATGTLEDTLKQINKKFL